VREKLVAVATPVQVQHFFDEHVRKRANDLLYLFFVVGLSKSLIDDVFNFAIGGERYNDNRTDGPPHLLQTGNAASPDDILNFNSAITLILKLLNGEFSSQAEANGFPALWTELKRAVTRDDLPV
jgi:hypothetical protein